MRLISSNLCKRRYKVEIKTKRITKRNKGNIYLFCILVILMLVLMKK